LAQEPVTALVFQSMFSTALPLFTQCSFHTMTTPDLEESDLDLVPFGLLA